MRRLTRMAAATLALALGVLAAQPANAVVPEPTWLAAPASRS